MSIEDAALSPDTAAKALKAAKDARRAMLLTAFAVAVAIAVLAIDNQIKGAIVKEAQDVREIFRQFREATDGIKAAIQDGADPSDADSVADAGGGGMADGAGPRAAANGDAAAGSRAKAGGKSGTKPGP